MLTFEDFSGAFDFLDADLPREEVDEVDEYVLSDPESLESDEPEPEELERRFLFSGTDLLAGGD